MPYYVRINGRSHGPFDESKLVELKSRGTISRITEVSENDRDWVPAEQFPFLYESVSVPSPSYNEPASQEVFEQNTPMEIKYEHEEAASPIYRSNLYQHNRKTKRRSNQHIHGIRQNTGQAAQSVFSWLLNFSFRDMRPKSVVLWFHRILYAIIFGLMILVFVISCSGVIWSSFGYIADTQGASLIALLLLPILCLIFFFFAVWWRYICEMGIILSNLCIELAKLTKAKRIYFEEMNKESKKEYDSATIN